MTGPTPAVPPVTAAPRKRISPRKRAQRTRLVQYAVLVALLVAAAAVADWHQIGQAFFRQDMIQAAANVNLFWAAMHTLLYAVGAFVMGIVFGTVLALMRLSQVAAYRWLAAIYVEFFRGLPAIIVLIAFGLIGLAFPGLTIPGGAMGTVWLGLGMVSAAYLSETIRAGIIAVPKGQIEAARSLGMRPGTAMRKIVLPQAFRIILPPIGNEIILLIKDSSLVYVIGLSMQDAELTQYGKQLASTNANMTPLVLAGLCYLALTLPLTLVVKQLEKRNAKAR